MVLIMEPAAPVRDAPTRLALAQAVAARRAAQANHAATVAAGEIAQEAVFSAYTLRDAAEAACAEAPQAAADHLQAVARGTAGPVPASAQECRAALQAAEDALAAARSANALLRERLPADLQRVAFAGYRCKDAALEVLRAETGPAAEEMISQLERAQETVAKLGAIAEALALDNVIERTELVKKVVARHATPPSAWGWQAGGNPLTGPSAAWRAGLAVLENDAEAPAVVGLQA